MTNVAGFFNQIVLPINLYIYEGIKNLYNLMLYIAESQIVSNETISSFSSRIYVLLGIFMLFKLSFSLVTYVVNPDEFLDKTKGITSIGKNIIISLVLIVLTPYLFQESRELQKNILNEHVVENLVFGDTKISYTRMNSGGDLIQFSLFAQWIKPNPEIEELKDCNNLYLFEDDGTAKMDNGKYALNETDCMKPLKAKFESDEIKDSGAYFDYEDGLKNKNVAYFYNSRIFTAEEDGKFLVKYNSLFSMISGIIVIFILISFCFDIAVRSIKLAFFQIMAPIPIISLCDPKGKDGMFKKWGTSVVKTYLSLFVRLVALYFSISIINQILIDPKWHQIESITEGFATAFIIIGALMFAKQLPGILSEITGVKLDSKFNLNPFKRVEEDAIGGKRLTGAVGGLTAGAIGTLTGAGLLRSFSGAISGAVKGKGFADAHKGTLDMNKKIRDAKRNGSGFWGRTMAGVESVVGIPTASERTEGEIHKLDEQIKNNQNTVKNIELKRDAEKTAYKETQRTRDIVKKSFGDLKETAIQKMKDGKGKTGEQYNSNVNVLKAISGQIGQTATWTYYDMDGHEHTQTKIVDANDVASLNGLVHSYENDGWMRLIDEAVYARKHHLKSVDDKIDTKLDVAEHDFATAYGDEGYDMKDRDGNVKEHFSIDTAVGDGKSINKVLGSNVGDSARAEAEQRAIDEKYYDDIKALNDENEKHERRKRELYERQQREKSNENARPFQ